jgi:parallel beta-helix repeat protein
MASVLVLGVNACGSEDTAGARTSAPGNGGTSDVLSTPSGGASISDGARANDAGGSGGALAAGGVGTPSVGGSGVAGSGSAVELGASVGTLELYGTFEAMGAIATLPAGTDTNQNALANLDVRVSGSANYAAAFPLTRVSATRFVGSLFGLTPGTAYDVRVRYSDPDGAPLDAAWAAATASTRQELSIPTPTRTLNVSATGSGTACSSATPCALSQALSQVRAGDEVLLGGGTYFQGGLSVSASGTAAAPIVIRGSGAAVLDGSDPGAFVWKSQGNGLFATTVNAVDPHLILAGGARLYPYADLAGVSTLSASNTPGFFASGTAVTIHLVSGTDPATAAIQVSRYNTALTITGSFVYVVGLTFQNYGLGDYAKALYIRDGSDNLVKDCRFITNDLGIGLKGTASRNVIEGNEFSDTVAGWTWEDVKAEGNLETGGVRFYSPVDGRGNVIRRNKFHDFFDGLGICPEASSAVTNETDFYANESYNNGDDGVETDGRCANVRLWNNVIHDTLAGVSLAPVVDGPVYCLRNRIFRIGAGTSQAGYSGLSFKLNSDTEASGSIYLLHNTVDAQRASTSAFSIQSPGTWQRLFARNNVWAGTLYAIYNANPTQPLDLDYDALVGSGSELVYWDGLPNRHLTNLAAVVSAVSQEIHGIVAAPAFVAPTSADFTPSSASPLLDRALHIPGINDGYAGAGPDIGAIERR